jgi:hypothetical protein
MTRKLSVHSAPATSYQVLTDLRFDHPAYHFTSIIFKDKFVRVENSTVIEKLIDALGKHKVLSREQAAERISGVFGKEIQWMLKH